MRLIDAGKLIVELYENQPMDWTGSAAEVQALNDWELFKNMVINAPAVDAVPVSELEKLRDYLYTEDLIFMRGLAELNKLIANCGAKMDEVNE